MSLARATCRHLLPRHCHFEEGRRIDAQRCRSSFTNGPCPMVAQSTAAAQPMLESSKRELTLHATFAYVKPPRLGEELYVYKYMLPAGVHTSNNLEIDEVEAPVTDLRTVEDESFNIVQNGFQFEPFQVPDIDWDDDKDITSRYYPEIETLLKKTSRASRVHIFDHTIRKSTINSTAHQQRSQKDPDARGQPVSRVHVDYTVQSGPARLRAALPDESEKLSKTPFAVIQVWRPLRGPVHDSPLGLLDAATVAKEDLLSYSLIFPERKGYNYAAQYNPNHRWYYAKGITAEEAYVFVCYDSREGRARFTPHTGFTDSSTPSDAVPRHSIETRAFVFWEDEPEQDIATAL